MTKRELMKKNIFWNMIGSFTKGEQHEKIY